MLFRTKHTDCTYPAPLPGPLSGTSNCLYLNNDDDVMQTAQSVISGHMLNTPTSSRRFLVWSEYTCICISHKCLPYSNMSCWCLGCL